jgi:leader peptidase (prepilin peptidase)/N-methyltransferase
MMEPDSPLGLIVLPPWGWVVAGLLGGVWGSFFNVAIHRLGLYESVVRPRSRCPRCSQSILARDNIPILSWILLRGRCRHCGERISVRYPIVELLTILLALAVYWRLHLDYAAAPLSLSAHFLVGFAFVGTLLVLAGVDLDHKIIPDRVTYPAIPAFFVAGLLLRDVPPADLLIGIVTGYGIVAVTTELSVFVLRKQGMGYGDAKLLALVGGFLGWRAVIFSFFVAPFFGLLLLVPILLLKRRRLVGTEVPYGPFLVAAALLYLFFGRALLSQLI